RGTGIAARSSGINGFRSPREEQAVAYTQTEETLSDTTKGLLSAIELLLRQRLGRLKEEVVDELGKATAAGTSLGGGLGMAALGTILCGRGFVHVRREASGL